MDLSSVGTALDLLTKTSKALDSVREQSKTSKDVSLKENVSRLYDDFLDLKSVILRLTEEVNALKAGKQDKPKIVEVGLTHYYYLDGDGPFCQPCYDDSGKFARLAPRQEYGTGNGRKCHVCQAVFLEDHNSIRVRTHSSPGDYGPWS